jgi:hypothetical protein
MTAKIELKTASGGKVILDPTDTAVDRTLVLPATGATLLTDSAGILNIGSGQVYKAADGKVGIGTASPGARLHVTYTNNTVYANAFRDSGVQILNNSADLNASADLYFQAGITGSGTGSISLIRTGSSAGAMAFQLRDGSTGTSTERLRITSAGSVGIGTSSPATIMHVDIPGATATSNGFRLGQPAQTAQFGFWELDTVTVQLKLGVNGGSIPLTFHTNNTERMRIDSSGNVGIGTSSPANPLAIISNTLSQLNVSAASGNTNAQINIDPSGTGIAIIGPSVASPLAFRTSNIQRMRLDTSGNLLVGTTTAVDVGSGSTDGTTIYPGNSAAGCIQMSNNNNIVMYLRRRSGNGGVVAFFRDTSQVGNISVTTTATAYNTSSDYRLKENIQPVLNPVDRLMQLKPINFAWKVDGTRVDGFLAHEAQEVVPEAVTGAKDAVDADGNPEYQGIDQSKLVPLLTAALQELNAKVDAQAAEIAALKGETL